MLKSLRALERPVIAAVLAAALASSCADVAPAGSAGSPTQPSSAPTAEPKPRPTPTPHPSATPRPVVRPPAAAPVTRTFPAKLPNGKPPLFVVVSFDGAGDLVLWSHWRTVAKRANARMTFFLSGPYLYPQTRRTDYRPPYQRPGASDIGWAEPDKAVKRAAVLRRAIAEGHEIGTHANGHFCGKGGIQRWSAPQWRAEFAAFDRMVRTGPALAAGRPLAAPFDPATVKGMRTPCLEGDRAAYRQVMRQRGMTYDASEPGFISWPRKRDGVWDFPLQSVELAGTGRSTLTMDYNLWYAQSNGRDAPVAHAPRLKAQVLATYRQALARSRAGSNPPLFLGNHFNRWNNSVYSDALTTFVEQTCTEPDVRCVTNAELVAWLARNGTPKG
ncbi:polysaccharide deacetylase [Kribbella flavida DSM 17836]|uniref:Polysaccharide deacetylase n=1 Tax=Kribbella flavida (strain DSM 17836 / JCM 10339 / NBRC 14399) TaxID=479435 RepID=D2PN68_KRIFD|nr:polysaccharide deacetylase [Kribbella flavida]ADB34552.1 polysaccharide deacetylase [Kribbella flavida DSM 17836]